MLAFAFLFLGLCLLFFGAQVLIKGSAALAFRFGLSALVIGLTVMAYGTSSPEMVVSINASLQGNGAISLGNVIGSNICNIALILGLCALITPLTAAAQVIRREIPILIGISVLMVVLLWDNHVSRIDGAILLGGIVVYSWLTIRDARREGMAKHAEYDQDIVAESLPLGRSVMIVLLGLVLLVGGSHLFVSGAIDLATMWGASEAVIGLTIVALGTSLPELATSLVAAFRRHSDVAIGNVVGSSIFNILGILGMAAVLRPIDASGISRVDLAVMMVVTIGLLPLARSGGRVSRTEGAVFLAGYIGYTAWLVSRITVQS